jgi:hypothetical protein
MKSFKELKSTMNSHDCFDIKNIKIVYSFIFVFLFFGFANFSSAATLSFSPASGTYAEGSYINVSVIVSSPDKVMNGASGIISFPTDLLSVSSISETGSILDVWAQQPTYSNTDGTINFEGVVLPPWYTGNSGKIITITFKAKEDGIANLAFSSGSVLAADGLGTDITSSLGTASYQISEASGETPVTMPPAEVSGVPNAPVITSDTDPDQTKWYADSDADFSWTLTKDITGDSLLIDHNPNSSPTVLYNPPINSKQITNLDDGVWYFHAQSENASGWGDVGTYKVQIDTTKPANFDITEIERTDPTDPNAKFTFNATDMTSGIDHYEVQIDNNPAEIWTDDGSHIYTAPAEEGGTHTLIAKAFDKAGNFLANSAEFSVQALEAPAITDYSSELNSGDIFTISGTSTYSNSSAELFLQDENGLVKNYMGKVGGDGNFTVVSSDRLKNGLYTAWVKIIDERGAVSDPSEKVTIAVKPSEIIQIGTLAVNFLAVLIPLLALIILLILLLWYARRKFFIIGDKLKKETKEAEDALHKAFILLKESVEEQIDILERTKTARELTKEEEKINKQLKKDLEDAEQYIMKENKDIDDLVNKK